METVNTRPLLHMNITTLSSPNGHIYFLAFNCSMFIIGGQQLDKESLAKDQAKVINPIEGLHFSAFHCIIICVCVCDGIFSTNWSIVSVDTQVFTCMCSIVLCVCTNS